MSLHPTGLAGAACFSMCGHWQGYPREEHPPPTTCDECGVDLVFDEQRAMYLLEGEEEDDD